MESGVRNFTCVDPFGRSWQVKFLWHQVGIAIRHADTIDCKFHLVSEEEETDKVIALQHPDLKSLAQELGREISDAWVIRLAQAHLRYMIESGEDMEKTLVTMGMDDIRRAQGTVAA
jgi:hypothetical protein